MRFVLGVLLLCSFGCGDERHPLFVDLRTDYVAGIEFDAVHTRVQETGETAELEVAQPDPAFATGIRVAELRPPRSTALLIEVALTSAGTVIGRRTVSVLDGRGFVTVVVTRDCMGIACPGPGDAPDATECLNGRCVTDRCVDAGEAECAGARCDDDEDCAVTSDCAIGRCHEGTCRSLPGEVTCSASEWCSPEVGCRSLSCVDRACCRGCWDGVECLTGDLSTACGVAGDPCRACGCLSDACGVGVCLPAERFVSVGAGREHSCAVSEGGALYCWGRGDATGFGEGTPDLLEPGRLPGDEDWVEVAAGDYHSCGIRERDGDRTLWCWGRGADMRLGTGSRADSRVPVQEATRRTDWLEVDVGDTYGCGRTRGNQILCWGANNVGQLGRCVSGDAPMASPVGGAALANGWVAMATGGVHACGVRAEDGGQRLYCWGNGTSGRLGTGDTERQFCPTPVGEDLDWQRVDAADTHTCAIKMDGTLWCWGDGGSGRLGLGDAANRLEPTRVGVEAHWVDIALGSAHTLALTATGALYGTGNASQGQLGLGVGERGDVDVPTLAPSLLPVVSVSTGWQHTCGVLTDGSARCWGAHGSGRLGLGEVTSPRLEITRVCFPVH